VNHVREWETIPANEKLSRFGIRLISSVGIGLFLLSFYFLIRDAMFESLRLHIPKITAIEMITAWLFISVVLFGLRSLPDIKKIRDSRKRMRDIDYRRAILKAD
jgi:hypothetical protein